MVGKDDFESAVLDSYADLIKDTFTRTLSHYNVLLGRTEGDKVSFDFKIIFYYKIQKFRFFIKNYILGKSN